MRSDWGRSGIWKERNEPVIITATQPGFYCALCLDGQSRWLHESQVDLKEGAALPGHPAER